MRWLCAPTGPACPAGYCRAVVVRFDREPANPHDSNAFRASVEGQHIGPLAPSHRRAARARAGRGTS